MQQSFSLTTSAEKALVNQKGNKLFGYQHLISPVSYKAPSGNFRGDISIARIIIES